jgi:F0F1-type ATP synthase assembly protein I
MKTKKQPKYTLENFPKFRISFFLKITSITVLTTIIFAFLGYFLDNVFNSKPLYLIISLVISFPVLQFILYRFVKKL